MLHAQQFPRKVGPSLTLPSSACCGGYVTDLTFDLLQTVFLFFFYILIFHIHSDYPRRDLARVHLCRVL